MAPSLITQYLVTATATGTLTSAAFTPSNGEVIVVKGITGDGATAMATPAGGAQTYTLRQSSTAGGYCAGYLWTAVIAGSPGSMSVSVVVSGSANWNSLLVERWSNAVLAATPAVSGTPLTNGGPQAPSNTITTVSANSVVSWCDGDWAAIAPAGHTYRSSAVEDGIHNGSTTQYVAYYAYQAAAATGSQTFGMTAPSTQHWTMVAVEVQSGAASAAATPPPLISSVARMRAANW